MLGIFHYCCVSSEAVIALLGILPNMQQVICYSLKTEVQNKKSDGSQIQSHTS